uniref:Uncharacterized protein n=1 Tax=Ciona savignyi TaxID=51511 RepID=H2YUK2_CIOSA
MQWKMTTKQLSLTFITQWAQEREEIEQETNELREKMDEKVQERVQELVQPYISAHEENKSLRSVLEMKNAEHHKLLLEMSQQSDLHAELRTYRDQIISLQQKNEDLRTQIQERNAEYRVVKSESDQLRQSCEDQQHSMRSQQQRIEELSYRLASPSTSPASPFNPVFTQSPTQSNDTSSPFGNGPFGRKTSERGHSSLASNEHRSPITTTPKCEGRT